MSFIVNPLSSAVRTSTHPSTTLLRTCLLAGRQIHVIPVRKMGFWSTVKSIFTEQETAKKPKAIAASNKPVTATVAKKDTKTQTKKSDYGFVTDPAYHYVPGNLLYETTQSTGSSSSSKKKEVHETETYPTDVHDVSDSNSGSDNSPPDFD